MFCCDQPYGTLGNLLKDGLSILNNDTAKRIRSEILANQLPTECCKQFCPYKFRKLSEATRTIHYEDHLLSIEIDLPNTHCNIGVGIPNEKNPACRMCARSEKPMTPDVDHLEEVCKVLAPTLATLGQLHIQGFAEPFYKDKLFEVLNWMDYDRHIVTNPKLQISTITNGLLFNKTKQERLQSRCPLTRICFSLDAASPEVYRKLRIVNAYHVAIRNLRDWATARRPVVDQLWINNTINLINIGDCVGMVETAAEMKVDYVQFGPTDPVGDIVPYCVNERNYKQFEMAEQKIVATAKKHNVTTCFRKALHMNHRNELRLL